MGCVEHMKDIKNVDYEDDFVKSWHHWCFDENRR